VQVVLMRQLSTVLVCGLAYLATSLSARAAEEYYIIRSTAASACELTHLPPRTTATQLLAGGSVYFSRNEALQAMQSLPECRQSDSTIPGKVDKSHGSSDQLKRAARRIASPRRTVPAPEPQPVSPLRALLGFFGTAR
jgi:hypothetical protein